MPITILFLFFLIFFVQIFWENFFPKYGLPQITWDLVQGDLLYVEYNFGYDLQSILVWKFPPKIWYSPNLPDFDTVMLLYADYYIYIVPFNFLEVNWSWNLLFSTLTEKYDRVTFSSFDHDFKIYYFSIF